MASAKTRVWPDPFFFFFFFFIGGAPEPEGEAAEFADAPETLETIGTPAEGERIGLDVSVGPSDASPSAPGGTGPPVVP